MTKVTTADLLAAIQEYGKELPKLPPGRGWITVKEMAQKESLSISAMRQRLRLAMDRGLQVERFTGSDYNEAGQLNKQTWFRVKP
jgi:hypothetical protein